MCFVREISYRYWKIYHYLVLCKAKGYRIPYNTQFSKARIRLEIEIEIRSEFNQSEERKSISSLVNFALIGQISI